MHPLTVLWLTVLLAVQAPLAAAHAAAATPVRMAVVLMGPPSLTLQVQEEMTLPLSGLAQIVQTSDYRRAAAEIGIVRHPRSNRAAPFVGRALGVGYVLLIDGLIERDEGERLFMGVRLVRAATGELLLTQRYFLPEGQLTPSIAAALVARIAAFIAPGAHPEPRRIAESMAQLPPPQAPAPSAPRPASPIPPAERTEGAPAHPAPAPPGPSVRPLGGPVPLAPATPPARPHAEAAPQAAHTPQSEARAIEPRLGPARGRPPVRPPAARAAAAGPVPHGWRRSWVDVAPSVAWRSGELTPVGSLGAPIPYGAGHGLGRPLLTGLVAAGLYVRRVGLELEVAGGGGSAAVPVGQPRVAQARLLTARAAVALELMPAGQARMAPRMGVLYSALPLNAGPFVALSVLGATAGARLASPMWGPWQVEATIDALLFGALGLEAARAGQPRRAFGVLASLTPRLHLHGWRAGAQLALESRSARFSGPTSLFAPAHYTAMQLGDTLLHVALVLGRSL